MQNIELTAQHAETAIRNTCGDCIQAKYGVIAQWAEAKYGVFLVQSENMHGGNRQHVGIQAKHGVIAYRQWIFLVPQKTCMEATGNM